MARRTLQVALISTTLLALEMVWTRVFSAEFFYAFAFLTLSLAILGLGTGGLALRLIPRLNGNGLPELALMLCGLCALAGPILVFQLGLDFAVLFAGWAMVLKFLAAILILGSAFFFGGMALAAMFKEQPGELPRLYRADLLGAGFGVVAALILMDLVGTPATAAWVAVPVLTAAMLRGVPAVRILSVILIIGAAVLSGRTAPLLEVTRLERAPVIYTHWDAMSKIKVYDYNGEARGINIDNVANTPVLKFDGDWAALEEDSTGIHWDIDVEHLISQFDSCRFLSLGSGGGYDVLQALDHGATEVHAVEVNGHIMKMLLEGDPSGYFAPDSARVDSASWAGYAFADSAPDLSAMPEFSGRLMHDPRVIPVVEDARTYVRRHPGAFDVIFSLSSNTWAALGSGSFALAENYLFTTEAFMDYWHALSEDGFLSMEHQVYMPRLVSEVLDALEALGVERPRDHFAVYNLPSLRRNVLLLSKKPVSAELLGSAYGPMTEETFGLRHLLYPAADSLQDNLIHRVVVNGWRGEQDSAAVNLSPCTDNRPFVAQMGLWRNLDREKLKNISNYAEFRGFPTSKLVLLVVLAVLFLVVVPLNLIPFSRPGPTLGVSGWLYFFLIGAAFMAVEIILIQRYTLFIGASVYSIAAVLLVLLVASGLGARFADRVKDSAVFLFIAAWLLLEVVVLRGVTYQLADLQLPARIAVSMAMVFPLGFFMGMPFPKGGLRVGELIDWGFAVNGAGSVLGATGVLFVVFRYGFDLGLTLALILYLAAYAFLRFTGRRGPAERVG